MCLHKLHKTRNTQFDFSSQKFLEKKRLPRYYGECWEESSIIILKKLVIHAVLDKEKGNLELKNCLFPPQNYL